jgi:hypothetical protein
VCSYVATKCILGTIAKALSVARLLALVKPFRGIRPIVVGEVFYRLMSRTLCFQFHDAFVVHLCPHQFGVTVKGGYKGMMHKIWRSLDVHLNWVVLQVDIVNAFNIVFCRVMF